MSTEYVRLSEPTLIYGKRTLLNSQVSILKITKNLLAYRNLRAEELVLKIALKNKIEDALSSLYLLEKLLPKLPEKESPDFIKEDSASSSSLSLEAELEEIRRKLAHLK